MVFSSPTFLFVFFPIVLIGYALCGKRIKNVWLLLASIIFYIWEGYIFIPIIVFSVIINYMAGICLERCKTENVRKWLLRLFVALNLGNLAYWKYTNFLLDILKEILSIDVSGFEIILPIGISFYTFQGISYVIDVYRREVPAQKKFGHIALYIMFFPQLIAGPIVRYSNIQERLNNRIHSAEMVESGLIRFIIGLAKKVILANTMGQIASQVFAAPCEENSVLISWIGAIAYTLQIYFDFSGYSEMAIGMGKIFGFSFPENFNYPYVSKSITEFWRRWHMTLSGWFRDYVYIPLGGNRRGNVYVNLFVVFVLTGIWHGANWTFVVWGIYYGVFIVAERWAGKNLRLKIPGIIGWSYTILTVIFGWVLFNAKDLTHAGRYIMSMFGCLETGKIRYDFSWYLDNYMMAMFAVAIVSATPLGKYLWEKAKIKLPVVLTKGVCYIGSVVLLLISMMYVMTSTYNPFIYFQF